MDDAPVGAIRVAFRTCVGQGRSRTGARDGTRRGHDFSAHITRGPIPLDEALPIARQIAEALEAAREAGIIHRDQSNGEIVFTHVADGQLLRVRTSGGATQRVFTPDAQSDRRTWPWRWGHPPLWPGESLTNPGVKVR